MMKYFRHSKHHNCPSRISQSTKTSYLDTACEDIRLVDITITIIGITHGILMQPSKDGRKKINTGRESPLNEPVLAVVSGLNSISSELSHVLSLPLENDTSSFQSNTNKNTNTNTYEFMAQWPGDLEENQQSTLTFTRKVKRSRHYHINKAYSYSSERLILAVSLMKGNEIITLGQVNVPFTYSEKKAHVQLPVRTNISLVKQAAAEMKGWKFRAKKTTHYNNTFKRFKKMSVKPLAFCDDPKRVYSFHDDSMLSVLVQTKATERIPHMGSRSNWHHTFSPDIHVYELPQRDNFGVECDDHNRNSIHIDGDGIVDESSPSHHCRTDNSVCTTGSSEGCQSHSISDISLDNSSQCHSLIADAFISIDDNANASESKPSHKHSHDHDRGDDNVVNQVNDKLLQDPADEEMEVNPKSLAKVASPKASGAENNGDYFPSVRVNSSATSSEAKDDTFTTSSWTFSSWMHHES